MSGQRVIWAFCARWNVHNNIYTRIDGRYPAPDASQKNPFVDVYWTNNFAKNNDLSSILWVYVTGWYYDEHVCAMMVQLHLDSRSFSLSLCVCVIMQMSEQEMRAMKCEKLNLCQFQPYIIWRKQACVCMLNSYVGKSITTTTTATSFWIKWTKLNEIAYLVENYADGIHVCVCVGNTIGVCIWYMCIHFYAQAVQWECWICGT